MYIFISFCFIIILILIFNKIGYKVLYECYYSFPSKRYGQRGAIDYSNVYCERHRLLKSLYRIRFSNETLSSEYLSKDSFYKNKFVLNGEKK